MIVAVVRRGRPAATTVRPCERTSVPRRSRTSTALGISATAVVALALAAPPALAGPAAAPDPVPSLVAGQDTAAPQLVTGLAEPAVGSPADAARAHLAAHGDRYHVDPSELAEVGSESTPTAGAPSGSSSATTACPCSARSTWCT